MIDDTDPVNWLLVQGGWFDCTGTTAREDRTQTFDVRWSLRPDVVFQGCGSDKIEAARDAARKIASSLGWRRPEVPQFLFDWS